MVRKETYRIKKYVRETNAVRLKTTVQTSIPAIFLYLTSVSRHSLLFFVYNSLRVANGIEKECVMSCNDSSRICLDCKLARVNLDCVVMTNAYRCAWICTEVESCKCHFYYLRIHRCALSQFLFLSFPIRTFTFCVAGKCQKDFSRCAFLKNEFAQFQKSSLHNSQNQNCTSQIFQLHFFVFHFCTFHFCIFAGAGSVIRKFCLVHFPFCPYVIFQFPILHFPLSRFVIF